MPTIRHTFLSPPVVGEAYQIGARSYQVLGSEPYTRRSDGADGELFIWRTSCEECDTPFTFKTGATAGDIQTRCRGCRADWWRDTDDRRKKAAAEEFTCRTPASPIDIHRAVSAVQAAAPRQMSLARNSSRRIFAPVILREAYAPLADYTAAEIIEGVQEALRRRLIAWEPVSRYRCGHVRRGLVARPEAVLRAQGWWPAEAAGPAGFFD